MTRFFERIGRYVERRWRLVLGLSLLFIVAALVPASAIRMETGVETMISTDTKEYKDYIRFVEHFGSDIVVVMLRTTQPEASLEDLLRDENLAALEEIRSEMDAPGRYPVITVLGPGMYLEQAVAQQVEVGELPPGTTLDDLSPAERAALVRHPEGGILPAFRQVLPDEHHALLSIVLQGNLESDVLHDVVQAINDAVDEASFAGPVEPVVTGMPALFSEIDSMFMRTTMQMVLLAIALLFVILALIFKVRGAFPRRWLPLMVVVVGVIYTFGLMGFIGIPMTMVSMAVFPIMIGLGIDYGIQFHNRYDEEALRQLSLGRALTDAVSHIGPAVLVALVAGSLGFAALFFSPVPMIRDFGFLLIIGVVMSYIVAVFPLTAILYWHDRRRPGKGKGPRKRDEAPRSQTGILESVLLRISPQVITRPLLIIPVAVGLTVGGLVMDSNIEVVTDQSTFINENMTAIKNLKELENGDCSLSFIPVRPTVKPKDGTFLNPIY